ncbi:MAG: hypothetical protein JNL56_07205 [Alphaproteobacteria bacterium]|nr:hypothetical protein [Alphaproteobacteria bacterium]
MLVSAVFAFVVAAAPAPALLLPAQPVGEPIDCNGPVFKSQIYRDDVECREVERRKLSIQDQTVTLRILADDEEDAELPPEYREAAVEAIARAFGIVAGERKLNFHNVSVLPVEVYSQRREAKMSGVTYWRGKSECVIALTVVPASRFAPETNLAMFKFIVAHEAFHCVQSWNWSHQLLLESANWWKEGSADLVAMLAYPGTDAQMKVNLGHADIASAKAVTQMDYGNILFFHWLWAQSPSKVFDLIAAMPRDPANDTIEAQEAALRAFLPGDAPQQYASAYGGAKIFR